MKVLAFGEGALDVAQANLWSEAEVVVPEWNFYDPPEKDGLKCDGIVAYFALQRVANLAVVEVLKGWGALLKIGGELHVHVPSLEWFAREILSPERPSPFALQHLFGLQLNEETFYLSAFTMSRLRKDMDEAGFAVRLARAYPYQMSINGRSYKAEQHHVMGVKR